MKIIKYTFDVPVVAIVSHIPAKSRMAVKYVSTFVAAKGLRWYKYLSFLPSVANWAGPVNLLLHDTLLHDPTFAELQS